MENKIDQKLIASAGLTRMFKDLDISNYVNDKYNGIDFEEADIITSESESNINDMGGGTTFYFRGKWMIFHLNKKFKTNIRIIDKSYKHPTIDKFSNMWPKFIDSGYKNHKHVEIYKKVEFEDFYLNDKFLAYVKDFDIIKNMVTQPFYDALKSIRENIDGEIFIGLIDNKLHIAIQNKNTNLLSRLFNKKKYNEQLELDSNKAKKLVDIINSDSNLFE